MAAVSVSLVGTALGQGKAPASVGAVSTAVYRPSTCFDASLSQVNTEMADQAIDFPVGNVATTPFSRAGLPVAALDPIASAAYAQPARVVGAETLVSTLESSVFAPTPISSFNAAAIKFDGRAVQAPKRVSTAKGNTAVETPVRLAGSTVRSISSVSLAALAGVYGSTALIGGSVYDFRAWDGSQFVYWSSTYAGMVNPNPLATLPVAAGPLTGVAIVGIR